IIQLIQIYIKNDKAVRINNLDYWYNCPAAIKFLSVMISASLLGVLKKTEVCCSRSDLIEIIWFTLISARTFYSYAPQSYTDI
ncbi:hypothetical protein BO94DRAFT_453612, partial [Aspergillus sclerotioniger CBS 115572]